MFQITMLSSMADRDFATALQLHHEWELQYLDLKDSIFGKALLELDDDEAQKAISLIREHGLKVYCLSTGLFYEEVERGEVAFRWHLNQVERAIELANILQPEVIRLLAPKSNRRSEIPNGAAYLKMHYPWIFSLLRQAIDRIRDAGFQVTIENEVDGCLMSNPEEIIDFFDFLDRQNDVFFTYDVQNLWQMGTFPSKGVVTKLLPIAGYLHLKGGESILGGSELHWATSLQDASWDVWTVLRDVWVSGSCCMVCLNPSHGGRKPNYRYSDMVKRDLEYVRDCVRRFQSEGDGLNE